MQAIVGVATRVGSVLLVAVLLYLGVCLFMFFKQRSFLYHIDTTDVAGFVGSVPRATNLELATADGEILQAWWIPPRDDHEVVYLYLQGNAETLLSRDERFGLLTKEGAGLLAVSWRGYGGSSGTPTEAGLRLDAVAAYEWLQAQFSTARIAVWLSSEHSTGGLVLDSPYTTIVDVARLQYPWLPVAWLARDRFESLMLAKTIEVPVFVFHCTEDPLIPFGMAEELLAGFKSSTKLFVPMPGICHVPSVETLMPTFKQFEGEVKARYTSY
jgi:fermentation-respiration switch protein FrsA (DUF1100 family)